MGSKRLKIAMIRCPVLQSRTGWDCDGYRPPEDCDDNNATIYPGADEDWEDGVDQDYDGNAVPSAAMRRLGNIETCDDATKRMGMAARAKLIEAQCTEGCRTGADCVNEGERCIGEPGDVDGATGQCEQTNVSPEA